MRILLHDYSGHPFQAELARALSGRGHVVNHAHCASYVSGKGRLQGRPEDPARLSFSDIPLRSDFAKYQLFKRVGQELHYAWLFVRHVRRQRPDVVLMCNTPLIAHFVIALWMVRAKQRSVFWHQDVYSQALSLELRKRFKRAALPFALMVDRMERFIAHRADHVVVIADTFLPVHERWGVRRSKITVQPNWAPVGEMPLRLKAGNHWAALHRLSDRPVVLYSGTLGLKHDMDLFGKLHEQLLKRIDDVALVVVTQGDAARHLERNAPSVAVLPFQEFEVLPDVLGSADLLLTLLEPAASDYSVPSKTLSYLCAGRPVLALLPESNPAATIVRDAGGLVFDPRTTGIEEIANDVAALLLDREELARRGAQARAYAEETFDIEAITDRFEGVLAASQR